MPSISTRPPPHSPCGVAYYLAFAAMKILRNFLKYLVLAPRLTDSGFNSVIVRPSNTNGAPQAKPDKREPSIDCAQFSYSSRRITRCTCCWLVAWTAIAPGDGERYRRGLRRCGRLRPSIGTDTCGARGVPGHRMRPKSVPAGRGRSPARRT